MFTYTKKTTATQEVTIQLPFYCRDNYSVMMVTENNVMIKVYSDNSVIKFTASIASQLEKIDCEITPEEFKARFTEALTDLDTYLL